jgi:hypothetical protein
MTAESLITVVRSVKGSLLKTFFFPGLQTFHVSVLYAHKKQTERLGTS